MKKKKKPIRSKKTKSTPKSFLVDKLPRRVESNDPDVEKMIARIHEIDDTLKEQVGDLLELGGRSAKEVENFLGDPKNFTDKFMKEIDQNRYQLEETLWGKKAAKIRKVRRQKKVDAASKKRKKKTLGARKKWIPMK